MKKVFAICLALVMVLTLNVSVMAAEDSFLNSPSNNRAPIVEDFKNESEDCTADIVVIPFGDRDNLSTEEKAEIQKAYDDIIKTNDLTNLFSGLDSILAPGTLSSDLSVSDLFQISYKDCVDHVTHGRFQITLSTETLKGFVGLVQIIDGEWVVVSDATVNGNKLSFSTDVPSIFAVVVDRTKAESTSPVTGAPVANYVTAAAVVAILCVGALSVLVIKKKA